MCRPATYFIVRAVLFDYSAAVPSMPVAAGPCLATLSFVHTALFRCYLDLAGFTLRQKGRRFRAELTANACMMQEFLSNSSLNWVSWADIFSRPVYLSKDSRLQDSVSGPMYYEPAAGKLFGAGVEGGRTSEFGDGLAGLRCSILQLKTEAWNAQRRRVACLGAGQTCSPVSSRSTGNFTPQTSPLIDPEMSS